MGNIPGFFSVSELEYPNCARAMGMLNAHNELPKSELVTKSPRPVLCLLLYAASIPIVSERLVTARSPETYPVSQQSGY
jgi:hypothetical protein